MTKSTLAPGVVNAQEPYSLSEIKRRLGLGSWAMTKARQKGLRVRKIGRREFLLGRDVLDFVATQPPLSSDRRTWRHSA